MWNLRRFLKPYRKQVILGPLFKFTEAVLELLVPVVMANIIDLGVANGDKNYIIRNGLLLALLGAVGLGCAAVCQYYASRASQGVGTDLRRTLFAHIESLSQSDLDRFGTSKLTTAVTGDTNQLQTAVAMLIRLVVRAPFIVIGAFAASFFIDASLSMIMLACIPAIAVIIWLVMSRTIPFYKKIRASLDRVSLIVRENLAGARIVRAFTRGEDEKKRFREASDALADTSVGAARFSSLLNPLTYVTVNLGVAAIIWAGGLNVDSGRLTQGELVAFVNYMAQINTALVVVANLVVTFTRAAASAERVNAIFATSPSVENGADDPFTGIDPSLPAVELRNVTFGYGGEPVLERVNLSIRRGGTVGIIGGTGAGKSTVAKLIIRVYDPDDGEVLINGHSLRECDLTMLRRGAVYVPQRAELISGSVADNIRMGDESMTDGDIENALRLAQADFVFGKSGGINCEVEQGGRNFSGGQAQRISIARALARKPEILILDDSTSALDAETSKKLMSALSAFGATKIIITQRPKAIRSADTIVVMDDGKIRGVGTHDELLSNCPLYAEYNGYGEG